MQKTLFILILFFIYDVFAFSSIGKVLDVKGIAFITVVSSKEKTTVKKGMPLFAGNIIRTEKNARVMIELAGGIKRILPESSELAFLSKKDWEIYQKTDPAVKKLFILSGKKASKDEESKIWEEKTLNWLTHQFQNEEFYSIEQWLEKSKKMPENPQSLYLIASALLRIGADEKSLDLFKKLLDSGSYEHRKIAHLGLYIIYIRAGKNDLANEIESMYENQEEILKEMKALKGQNEF